MNKPDLSKFMRNIQGSMVRHGPEILTGLGIAGMITTTVMAVKATPKALKLIEEAENQRTINEGEDEDYYESLQPIEVVKLTWKLYAPASILGVMSVMCLVGASSVGTKRTAVIATAYKISETALADYREKVIETIGEKKEHAVRDKVVEKKLENNPVNQTEVIITDRGNTLCYDTTSARYFRSDIDKIKKVENELNLRMRNDNYVSLNELYISLGLEPTSIGDKLGWNIERNGYLDIYYSAQLTKDGEPCLALDYSAAPEYDYSKLEW